MNMTIICNIQMMSKIIGKEIPFKELENKSYGELRVIQEDLIPKYNTKVRSGLDMSKYNPFNI